MPVPQSRQESQSPENGRQHEKNDAGCIIRRCARLVQIQARRRVRKVVDSHNNDLVKSTVASSRQQSQTRGSRWCNKPGGGLSFTSLWALPHHFFRRVSGFALSDRCLVRNSPRPKIVRCGHLHHGVEYATRTPSICRLGARMETV